MRFIGMLTRKSIMPSMRMLALRLPTGWSLPRKVGRVLEAVL
jgi:hypothetical protein